MRVFTATLGTETNTFAPMPTGIASFKEGIWYPGGEHPPRMTAFSAPLFVAREKCAELGWELREGLVTFAQPSGITPRLDYELLRDQLLGDLRAALPAEVVLIGLHGAMVAEGYDDCEGDLLARIREITGDATVIGAELDPHCHMSDLMLRSADLMIAFKEYPHTDALERARELFDLCQAQIEGRIKPVAALVDTGMVAVIHTPREPVRSFVDRIMRMEGQGGVLSISIVHGFPWGDVPDMGTKVLVYTDGDEASAQRLARDLAEELWRMREALPTPYPDIDAALDQALAVPTGPVVIADSADNPGGGAAGDSTFVLRRIVGRGIKAVALGPMWDPGAVRIAFEAGVGARLGLRIGGKVSPLSGDPIDLDCTVKALHAQMRMSSLSNTQQNLGDCALVEANGVEIVLITLRSQAIGTDLFTNLGCDLAGKRLIVVKSSQHFYAAYSKVAAEVIYCGAPGSVTMDWKSLPYQKIARPKWPLD